MKATDKEFFQSRREIFESFSDSVESFIEEADERGDENFTEEQLSALMAEARKVQSAANESVLHLILAKRINRAQPRRRVVRMRKR